MESVAKLRASLENRQFQVIVIGGGINGTAIARECARAGRQTLLVEQDDFGAGTTSRSTRIIHGGLRYLEHGEFSLVRESLRERKGLLTQYSHLVHPLQFLLALNENSRRSALKVRTGLWLYRTMAGNKRDLGTNDQAKLERLLDAGQHWSVFSFQDAQCEFPERLVAEWLVEAIEAGAIARNHTQVLAIDVRHGRAKGVLLRDRFTGREERVEGSWIFNATGPWADRICQRSRIKSSNPLIGGVRGSHLILPHFPGAPDSAVYSEAMDGRPIFVIPWNQQILVGTTEVADSGDPGKVQPSPEEVEYLLRSLTLLFPKANLSARDVRWTMAGIRPLPYAPKSSMSSVTRKHYLHDHKNDGAARVISVVGGKLTTAASLARQCVLLIKDRPRPNDPLPPKLAIPDIDPLLDDFVIDIANAGGISENSAAGIVEWHGKRASSIAQMALSSAELRAPLCAHTEHIVAEALDAFANESAMTLGDVLLRRVPVALGLCWSQDCSREAAQRIRAVMGWTANQTESELNSFELERHAFLQPRS